MADAKTDLAGLADPNAAVLATVTLNLPPEAIAQYKALVATAKQQIQGELATGFTPPEVKQAFEAAMAVLDKTLDGGKIDGGLSVGLAPKNVQVVAGLKIADGAKLNDAVKTIAGGAMKAAPGVRPNVEARRRDVPGRPFPRGLDPRRNSSRAPRSPMHSATRWTWPWGLATTGFTLPSALTASRRSRA